MIIQGAEADTVVIDFCKGLNSAFSAACLVCLLLYKYLQGLFTELSFHVRFLCILCLFLDVGVFLYSCVQACKYTSECGLASNDSALIFAFQIETGAPYDSNIPISSIIFSKKLWLEVRAIYVQSCDFF